MEQIRGVKEQFLIRNFGFVWRINMSYKERTPVKCSCSLRSLVGFDISEAQAVTLIGIPIIDRRSNDNKDTAIGVVDAI